MCGNCFSSQAFYQFHGYVTHEGKALHCPSLTDWGPGLDWGRVAQLVEHHSLDAWRGRFKSCHGHTFWENTKGCEGLEYYHYKRLCSSDGRKKIKCCINSDNWLWTNTFKNSVSGWRGSINRMFMTLDKQTMSVPSVETVLLSRLSCHAMETWHIKESPQIGLHRHTETIYFPWSRIVSFY